jgi:phage gp36-like protein
VISNNLHKQYCLGDTARIRRCLLTGFFSQVAQYEGTQTGVYLTLRDAAPFKIYKGSTVLYCKEFPKYVLFTDVLSSSIRDVSSIDLEWLKELNQNYYDFGVSISYKHNVQIKYKQKHIKRSKVEQKQRKHSNCFVGFLFNFLIMLYVFK